MAENDARKTYPKVPASNWWNLRRRIQQSVPKRVDADYLLTALDLSSTGAAANIVGQLRSVGLIAEDGSLTELAHDWRDDGLYPDVCARMMEKIYPAALRDLFPGQDPELKGLRNWFVRNAKVGEAAAGQMAAFYRLLAQADLSAATQRSSSVSTRPTKQGLRTVPTPAATATKAVKRPETPPPPPPAPKVMVSGVGGITINIELQIPATADTKFFDEFFASMRRNLIEQNA